jgi:FkbM family methyltransferase
MFCDRGKEIQVMIERIGSEYGGFWIDPALIANGSTAICAGIGNDITFDVELIRRFGCRIIGIDPTQRAREHIERKMRDDTIAPENYDFIPRALYGHEETLYCHSFRTIWGSGGDKSQSVTPEELFDIHKNVSLVKLDIEGCEFSVISELEFVPDSVKQFCIEFHHRLPEVPFELDDVEGCVSIMKEHGFVLSVNLSEYEETLFIRNRDNE